MLVAPATDGACPEGRAEVVKEDLYVLVETVVVVGPEG